MFTGTDQETFKTLLRRMLDAKVGLLERARDGTLLPGPNGERLIESRDIFSVFVSEKEYRVVGRGGRAIGQIPSGNPLVPGQLLILAGRRWRIMEVDDKRKEVIVQPARGGRPPVFNGDPVPPADGVLDEMRKVYTDLDMPGYLDATAQQLLVEARTTFDRLGLRYSNVVRSDGQLLLFPWVGGRRRQALLLALVAADLDPVGFGLAIAVPAGHEARLGTELQLRAAVTTPHCLTLRVIRPART